MSTLLLQPPGNLSPAQALEAAKQASTILHDNPKAISSSPILALFSASESADLWTIYENLLVSSLRVGDDQSARQVLDRLVTRFGSQNERIQALQGLAKEAEASNVPELEKILKEYEAILEENDANVPVAKRRASLLRSMGKYPESVAALNSILEFSPTDAEIWAELADIYVTQGLYSQAIFALEETVVLQPNAWNVHARLGEIELMASDASLEANPRKFLAGSLKRFCRSIELCDDYLRGFYGLKLVTDKLLSSSLSFKKEADEYSLPSQATIQTLNRTATEKLAEIVRRNEAKEPLWQGYDVSEVVAAKALLSKSAAKIIR